MAMIRNVLQDRLLRGALAAFLGYFLVIQLFVGGFSAGAMAAAFDDAGFVICAPSGNAPQDNGAPRSHDGNACPCATVCQLSGLDARPAGDAASIFLRLPPDRPRVFAQADASGFSPAPGLVSDARAPPFFVR